MRKTILGAVLVAGLAMTGVSWAQGPGMMGPDSPPMGPDHGMGMHRPPMERSFGERGIAGRWWNKPKVVEKLKLTDDQRKTFDGILQEHREKLIDLRANVQKAEVEMTPMMRGDHPNESAILTQIDKVAQARAELEKANARYLLAIRSKLTPEQWKSIQDLRADRMKHERDGRQWGHGPAAPSGARRRQQAPPPAAPGADAQQ